MKKIYKITFFLLILTISSCSSTKNIDNSERDGSSFSKAIIINSISEEYDYVKKACSNCQLLGQSLSFEKKKPFDILQLKMADGNTVSYYFDISIFFGKGF